jgi:hypothetical protein
VSGYPLARSRVRIGGRFFASTSVSPQKDVGAFAELEMVDGAATTLRYRVQYCEDVACETGTVLYAGSIGTLPSFGKAKVLIDWDGAGNVFRFQVDGQTLVTVGHTVNDSATPSLQRKGIQITHAVPTCPAGSHAEGSVQAGSARPATRVGVCGMIRPVLPPCSPIRTPTKSSARRRAAPPRRRRAPRPPSTAPSRCKATRAGTARTSRRTLVACPGPRVDRDAREGSAVPAPSTRVSHYRWLKRGHRDGPPCLHGRTFLPRS